MTREVLLAASLLLAAIAGCSDPPLAEPSEAPGPPLDTGPASSTTPDPTAGAAPEPVATAVPFERQGRTWTTACLVAPPAVAQCQHVAEGSDLTEFLPAGEPILRLRGELTWEAGNDQMGIGIVVEENGTLAMASPDHYAEGPSPLAFDFDLAAWHGERLGFHVASYTSVGAAGAHADASPGQDWSLTGELTVLRAA